MGTPASSNSTANVSRNICGWQRFGVPSGSWILANANSFQYDRWNALAALRGSPFPDQKKYRGLAFGSARKVSATSAGITTKTGTPDLSAIKENLVGPEKSNAPDVVQSGLI